MNLYQNICQKVLLFSYYSCHRNIKGRNLYWIFSLFYNFLLKLSPFYRKKLRLQNNVFCNIHLLHKLLLTLNLLNFLNGLIHLPFLELSIIIFREIKIAWISSTVRSDCKGVQAGLVLYCWLTNLSWYP